MKENKDSEVAIPDIEPEVFNKLLEFIYTDKITNLDADAAYLLEAADKYQLLNLKSLCEELLPKSVSIDNAIELMILTDLHNANQLLEFNIEFMIKNIKDVAKTPEYELRYSAHRKWSILKDVLGRAPSAACLWILLQKKIT
ncbi:speckle-type POZ protein B-like [Microplitis mediator]|uniref:speckle-type POZ protein B-like n=1 Tax=Microplitis mediator TaxID=375433 RepID=UPI00255314D5|nr:speckle-type POZ protein B-like [Microplitis mediator]